MHPASLHVPRPFESLARSADIHAAIQGGSDDDAIAPVLGPPSLTENPPEREQAADKPARKRARK